MSAAIVFISSIIYLYSILLPAAITAKAAVATVNCNRPHSSSRAAAKTVEQDQDQDQEQPEEELEAKNSDNDCISTKLSLAETRSVKEYESLAGVQSHLCATNQVK